VNLPEIGEAGLAASEIAMPDQRAGVGVAFHPMAFHKFDPILRQLAEVVTAIGGDRDHRTPQQEPVRLRHQAARTNELGFRGSIRMKSSTISPVLDLSWLKLWTEGQCGNAIGEQAPHSGSPPPACT
jgi:hypothetical protein